MTLEKVQMASMGHPFLIPIEIEVNKEKITLKGEPRQIKTKFKDGQWVIDCEIKEIPTDSQYRSYNLEDLDKRQENKLRTYSINDTSFNKLIDLYGDDETKWNDIVIALEVLSQVVQGNRKQVIYVEGAI